LFFQDVLFSLCRCADGVALFTEGLLSNETAEVFVTKDKKTFREGLLKKYYFSVS